ncbi:MbcA/ParS/Xre antitoxin family protein [Tistrella mobilis]|nr:MbcA/ParS/Xre antitoxin family protein [Tistrella mobilis]
MKNYASELHVRDNRGRVPTHLSERPASIAGLLHDIGKFDSAFQRDLRRRLIATQKIARVLGVPMPDVVDMLGVDKDSLLQRRGPRHTVAARRLKEMLEILQRVEAWAGGPRAALSWYRAYPIPALGNRTAESLVKTGGASAVRDYLDHVALGGYA